jgi:hypothetical protein
MKEFAPLIFIRVLINAIDCLACRPVQINRHILKQVLNNILAVPLATLAVDGRLINCKICNKVD